MNEMRKQLQTAWKSNEQHIVEKQLDMEQLFTQQKEDLFRRKHEFEQREQVLKKKLHEKKKLIREQSELLDKHTRKQGHKVSRAVECNLLEPGPSFDAIMGGAGERGAGVGGAGGVFPPGTAQSEELSRKESFIKSYVRKLEPQGKALSKEWGLYMVNMICHDKIKADFDDSEEFRPQKNFQAFVREWFLTKFGSRGLAHAMQRNLLQTLLKYDHHFERFRVMRFFLTDQGSTERIEDELSYKVLKSTSTVRVFLKLIFHLRCGRVPFMPNFLFEEQPPSKQIDMGLLVRYEAAKNLFENVMNEEGFNLEKLNKTPEMLFGALVISVHGRPRDDMNFVAFDSFLSAAVKEFVGIQMTVVNSVVASLQILQIEEKVSNENGFLFFEDYQAAVLRSQANFSQRWVRSTYEAIIDALHE